MNAIAFFLQIGCSIFGSLGALFNGLLLIDLALGLFALVAIDRSSERLGRTYAVLLICAIILDVQWFILFSRIIWYDFSLFIVLIRNYYSVRNGLRMPHSDARHSRFFVVAFAAEFFFLDCSEIIADSHDNADNDSRSFVCLFCLRMF